MAKELVRGAGASRPAFNGSGVQFVADAALGAVSLAASAATVTWRGVSSVAGPVARVLWRPPLVPTRLQPATLVASVAQVGRSERDLATQRAVELLDTWVPAVVEVVLERLDLTMLVAQHVDLDALVAAVDLDAAVARVDLDAAVARVDLDAAVARVDLDRAVARVDIEAIIDRVDVDAVVARADLDAAVARVDLDAAVARVSIEAIIDRLDLDAVAGRLDIDAIAARIDLDAIIDRIDLVGIVEEVLDEIDLPEIIRQSTGSMASETVRDVRMTGVSADDAVQRAVDRVFFRRRRDPSGAP